MTYLVLRFFCIYFSVYIFVLNKNVLMAKKEEYKIKNQEYLKEISTEEGIVLHPSGILYKVINSGDGKVSPVDRSIVTVHYRGTLINGREFDNSWKRSCPEALRLTDVIDGWRIALKLMHVGDRWMVYIHVRAYTWVFNFSFRDRTFGYCLKKLSL